MSAMYWARGPNMNNHKLCMRNVKKLEVILNTVSEPLEELAHIVDTKDSCIERAWELHEKARKLIDDIRLLRHDLRDDYGTGYKLTQGE
jgi:hypothetical protein